MVGIDDDYTSKQPMPQLVKSDKRLMDDGTPPSSTGPSQGKESQIAVILAKAAIAAKRQIAGGIGNHSKAAVRTERPGNSTANSGELSTQQSGFGEENLVRNLKDIVTDDDRWGLFALGALGLPTGSGSCNALRDCLLRDLKDDTWEGVANLVALSSKGTSGVENARASAPTPEDLSTGLIERTKLWLAFPNYFENLFNAVQENNLSKNVGLYTDELLIKYLDTIGQ